MKQFKTTWMDWYLKVLRDYAVFSGRARRKEFWMFTLFNFVFLTITALIDNVLGITFDDTFIVWDTTFKIKTTLFDYGFTPNGYVYLIYSLSVLVPTVAVLVRRLHDVGKSGWFSLIPIYNLILVCTSGDKGDNKWLA